MSPAVSKFSSCFAQIRSFNQNHNRLLCILHMNICAEPKERITKEPSILLFRLGCLKQTDLGGSSLYHVLFVSMWVAYVAMVARGAPRETCFHHVETLVRGSCEVLSVASPLANLIN